MVHSNQARLHPKSNARTAALQRCLDGDSAEATEQQVDDLDEEPELVMPILMQRPGAMKKRAG